MEASLNLRRHFLSRSAQLITPLARYLNTLIPSPAEVKQHARNASELSLSSSTTTSSSTTRPSTSQRNLGLRLKPFNHTNFFASLKTHGCILPFKSTRKKTEFYERCVFIYCWSTCPKGFLFISDSVLFRWLKSPTFGTWLAQQEQIVQTVLNDPPPSNSVAIS